MARRKRIVYDPFHDLYNVVGASPGDAPAELQHAYRQRAKLVHPDRNPQRREWAKEQFQALNEAYDILSDPDLRGEYDRARMDVLGYWQYIPTPPRQAPDPVYEKAKAETRRYYNLVYNPFSFWSAVVRGLSRGSYRFVLLVLGVVFLANIVFFTRFFDTYGAAIDATATAISNNRLVPSNVILVTFIPSPGVPTVAPTCSNPGVTITTPQPGFEINADAFDVRGSATHPDFYSYTLEIVATNGRDGLVLSLPATRPVTEQNGTLARNLSIKNLPIGDYILRLRVQLKDSTWLPPCEIRIRRKL